MRVIARALLKGPKTLIFDEATSEVQIDNKDVGFVAPTQEVRVKLAAYPFQKYGMIQGAVKTVSADLSSLREGEQRSRDESQALAFKALIELKQQLSAGRVTLPLAAGVRVSGGDRAGAAHCHGVPVVAGAARRQRSGDGALAMTTRVRALACIVFLLVCASLPAYDKARGTAVVGKLCAKDGGERIFATTFVDGYLDEAARADDCRECRDHLGRGEFRYVDIRVPDDLVLVRTLLLGSGYYRFSLAAKGDSRCDIWTREPRAEQLFAASGISAENCIAIAPLQERPGGYSFTATKRDIVVDGVPIHVSERAVLETESREPLAVLRDYQFTARLSALLDMSGHGGNIDASCLDGTTFVRSARALAARTLRDERQQGDLVQ